MKTLFAFIALIGAAAALGFSALGADCPKISAQQGLNPLVTKNADMPIPDEAKNATCGGFPATTVIARPRTLNPITSTDNVSTTVVGYIYDALTGGPAAQPTPFLAEAFEVKSFGAQGQSVTFTIRKGAKFANGDPVTAEDVRFTVENLIFPADIANSIRDVTTCGDGKLPTVKVDSVDKITFTCAVTVRTFVATMDPGVVLNKKVVLSLVPNVEKSPKDFNTALSLTTPLDKMRGIGTGTFILTRIDASSAAEFTRNPNYWGADEKGNQLPYVNGYRLLFAPTQGQEIGLAQFRNGQTDYFGPRPEDIAVLQSDKASKNFQVNDDIDGATPAAGTTFWAMSWTTKNPALRAVFNSKEFRQAMSQITDRATMKKNILLSLGTETFSHLNHNSAFFIERQGQTKAVLDDWEKRGKYPFDLTKANATLDKLGLVKGADGIRTIPANFQNRGNPAGKLEFILNTNVGNTLREEMIKQIAADARKAGVNIKAEPKDFAALVDQLTVGDYEAILIGLTGGIVPEGGSNIYTCEGNLHFYNVDCPGKPSDFEKKTDELYLKGAASLKNEDAEKIWDEVQILIGENQPLVHTVQGNALFAYRIDAFLNHARAPFANQQFVYCVNGKCRGG